jgi:hypothetical protein
VEKKLIYEVTQEHSFYAFLSSRNDSVMLSVVELVARISAGNEASSKLTIFASPAIIIIIIIVIILHHPSLHYSAV